MSYILVSGVSVIDFIFSVSSLPTSAEKYRAGSASIVCGGVAMNAAVGISRLGGSVRLASSFGDDMLGNLIHDTLVSEQISQDYIYRFSDTSSFSSINVDSTGERQIVAARSPSMESSVKKLDDLLNSSSIPVPSAVLVDPYYDDTATNLLLRARDWGIPGVIDGENGISSSQISAASHIAFLVRVFSLFAILLILPLRYERFRAITQTNGCVSPMASMEFITRMVLL